MQLVGWPRTLYQYQLLVGDDVSSYSCFRDFIWPMTMTWRDALKQRGILLTIVQLYFLVVRSRTSLLRRIAFYRTVHRTPANTAKF